MDSFQINNLRIILNKEGAHEFSKVSYPLRYGRYSEIQIPGYTFQFNLNGEIKFITSREKDWPDPSEYLKRTVSNDWIYYSTGGYSGVHDSFGEYYMPCLSYPSNAINLDDPFQSNAVKSAIAAWHQTRKQLQTLSLRSLPRGIKDFLNLVIKQSPQNLQRRSDQFHEITEDNVTVLPPDTRHVDYDVIPVIVSDGCLYKCGFCRVKSRRDFSLRTKENIKEQIERLESFYGQDIRNHNAIFIGQHDALYGGGELLEFTARYAFERFDFARSNLKGSNLFLFGSVDAMLKADDTVFDRLEELPFSVYINMGLESADQETLTLLEKAITPTDVDEAFLKMLDINKRYKKIEITANFVFGDGLPKGHLHSFFQLVEKRLDRYCGKGAFYFSPLITRRNTVKRGIKRAFYKIKARSRLPTFLYLIQRL
jgi:hypothetical protein